MQFLFYKNILSGLAGFIVGGLFPIFLVVLLKFSASSICKPGKLLAKVTSLNSSFGIYTPTESVGIYSIFLTILIYAILFSIIFVGVKLLFGSKVQNQ